MIKRIFLSITLLIFSSCSLFKTTDIQTQSTEELMAAIKIEGEGRGRLRINDQQFVFSFDSLLTDDHSWILAANFPLHGEESLTFSNLKSEKFSIDDDQLALRMEEGIRQYLVSKKKNPKNSRAIFIEMRKFVRFALAKRLNLKQDSSMYEIEVKKQELLIKKQLTEDLVMSVKAQNLTESFFKNLKMNFHSQNSSSSNSSIMEIELFYQ